MKALVIGGGGREHALAYALKRSPEVDTLYIAPGNAGTANLGENVAISASDIKALADFAEAKKIDLTVVGPEAPLVAGIVELFESRGLRVFGPKAPAAELEGSKVLCKQILVDAQIPTARHVVAQSADEARKQLSEFEFPVVIKADGLAAGKGVIICGDEKEANEAIDLCMVDAAFGDAGKRIIIEEFLEGEEASFIAITDGKTLLPLVGSQDHKQVFDGDRGPNTGGMGAYSPAPVLDDILYEKVKNEILQPTIDQMNKVGRPFAGILYAGLMIKNGAAKVLEYNVRLGDPEAQPLLMRLKSDLFTILFEAADGRLSLTEAEWDTRASCCVVMAAGGYPGSYAKGLPISGLDNYPDADDLVVFHAGTKLDGGRVVTSGGRVLGVTALGDTVEQARNRAYEAVHGIDFEGAHYRTDIAAKALGRS
jgi:phosphoribosylamine---glycine ligase